MMDAIICIYFSLQITIKPTKTEREEKRKFIRVLMKIMFFFLRKKKNEIKKIGNKEE